MVLQRAGRSQTELASAVESLAAGAAAVVVDGGSAFVGVAAFGNAVVGGAVGVGAAVGIADSASSAGDTDVAVVAGSVPFEDAASAGAVEHAAGCHMQPYNTDCSPRFAEAAAAVGAAEFAVAAPALDVVSSAQLAAAVVSVSQFVAEA